MIELFTHTIQIPMKGEKETIQVVPFKFVS